MDLPYRRSGMAKENGTVNRTAISDLSGKVLRRYLERLLISVIILNTLAVRLQKTGLPSQLKWTAGKRVHIALQETGMNVGMAVRNMIVI